MNPLWLERSGVALAMYFAARTAGRLRGAAKQRAALATPLADAAVLEAAFHPRPREGDDAALLAELRDTFAHLNRQAWAEEFWGLHAQIAALDGTLGPAQKATLRRALLRLLTSPDRWLQLVAARTAAEIGLKEAAAPLRALLEGEDAGGENRGGDGERRFRAALEESLAALTVPAAGG